MEKQVIRCDIAVIGGGPAGQLAALELACSGRKVALVGPRNKGQETRTTALMMPSVAFLQRHALWESLREKAAPLRSMCLADGTKRLIRSPAVRFHAREIGLEAFGYNIPNQALNAALAAAVSACPAIIRIEELAESYSLRPEQAEIKLAGGGEITAQLIIAADGRNSKARQAADISVSQWAYLQTALTLSFAHEFPHNFISTEFHTESGPFTQVPLSGNHSALIWTVSPEKARHLLGLGREALAQAIGGRMGFMLGKVEIDALPEAWPMGGMTAKKFAAKRVALVGEAAHIFPPIGAQGLNLTIRDCIALGQAVARQEADAGAQSVLDFYDRKRRPDILFRTGLVHALNRALLSDFLPVQFMRSAGLEFLRANPLARNIFMREGMAPGGSLKKLLPPFLHF